MHSVTQRHFLLENLRVLEWEMHLEHVWQIKLTHDYLWQNYLMLKGV